MRYQYCDIKHILNYRRGRQCGHFYVQIAETGHPGQYKLWALIGNDLHAVKLNVPRIFYVNQKTPKEGEGQSECVVGG